MDKTRTDAERFWSDEGTRHLLEPFDRVALAVSGGADSLALLSLMASTKAPKWAPDIACVAHVNHGLQAEAATHETLVKDTAGRLNVPFRVRRLDAERIHAEAKEKGGLEAAARHARYRALREIIRASKSDALLTAHHEDDQAETLLMRLLRGSGLAGLRGLLPRTENDGIIMLRPLLTWSHADLRTVCTHANLKWAEDATNTDNRFLRNRIRHEVLPYIERATDHPPATAMIARTAARLGKEYEAIEAYVSDLYSRNVLRRTDPERIALPLSLLSAPPESILASYFIRLMLCETRHTAYPPEHHHIEAITAWLDNASRRSLFQTCENCVLYLDADKTHLWAYQKPRRNVPRERLIAIFEED